MEMQASNSCLTQLTTKKSSVVQESGVPPGTKNEKGKFVVPAGTEFSFKEDAKHSRLAVLIL